MKFTPNVLSIKLRVKTWIILNMLRIHWMMKIADQAVFVQRDKFALETDVWNLIIALDVG